VVTVTVTTGGRTQTRPIIPDRDQQVLVRFGARSSKPDRGDQLPF
jgi:hypothetical protein